MELRDVVIVCAKAVVDVGERGGGRSLYAGRMVEDMLIFFFFFFF